MVSGWVRALPVGTASAFAVNQCLRMPLQIVGEPRSERSEPFALASRHSSSLRLGNPSLARRILHAWPRWRCSSTLLRRWSSPQARVDAVGQVECGGLSAFCNHLHLRASAPVCPSLHRLRDAAGQPRGNAAPSVGRAEVAFGPLAALCQYLARISHAAQ